MWVRAQTVLCLVLILCICCVESFHRKGLKKNKKKKNKTKNKNRTTSDLILDSLQGDQGMAGAPGARGEPGKDGRPVIFSYDISFFSDYSIRIIFNI